MNKIKICFPVVGDSIGGSALSCLDLINILDKKKFDIFLPIHVKGDLYKLLKEKKIKIHFMPLNNFVGQKSGFLSNLLVLLQNFFKIFFYIKRNKINFVHSNDGAIHLTWVIPTLFTKSKFFWHQRVKFPNWRLYKLLSNFSDKIICISNYVYSTLPTNLRKKTIIIYDPISIIKKKMASKEKKLISYFSKFKNKKKIIFLANIINTKKIDVFLKTSISIFRQNKNCIFLVIGSDRFKILKKLLLNIKNKKFKKNFFYLNKCYQIKKWFNISDVLISTSVNEGLNRSIVEAMLCKLPVVASKSGAHKELIFHNKTGWLIKPNDYKEFAKYSLKLFRINKKKISILLENAYLFAKDKFSPKNNKNEIQNLYIKSFLKNEN